MVAAANKALSATADGNQKKPVFPGFIPPGANPQQVAAALAARPATNVLAGTGLGLNAAAQAPVMVTDGMGPRPAPQPEPAKKMGWNDVPPMRAPDNARNIYANMGNAAASPDTAGQMMSNAAGLTNRPLVAAATPAPVVPQQPKPASAGVDGIPTGGPTGWTGGATQPAPKTAFGDLQSTIQNQVEKAVWGSTITPSPSTGLPSPQKPSTAPVAQPYRNEGQNYTAGGKVQSPAVTTAPAGVPQRNAAGALTSLGAGTDVVGGIKKYVVDGKTLYSNMGDSGDGGNLSLMNRGAPTAQSMAAMDALAGRYAADTTQAVQRMQFNDQVAQAQAINARPNPEYTNPNDLRDPANIAARNRLMDMQMKSGESPQAYGVRVQAMAEAQRLAATQGNANADRGLKRDELTANQQIAQSKLGIDQQQLGLKQQQVGNELATGAQSRDAKGMEIAAAKQLQTLQAQLLDPNITNAKRTEVAKLIAGLSGKTGESSLKDNFLVVGGGQEFDQKSNQLINKPQSLIDLRTGLAVSGPPNGGSPSASFVEGGIYPLTGGGSAVFKDGKLKRVE